MRLSPAKILVLFFLSLTALGTLILSLPISINPETEFDFLSNLFTAASAVSITGLSAVDIGSFYSPFGRFVILFLVQMGALGYMLVSAIAAVIAGRVTIKDRRIMQELFDITSFGNLKNLLLKAIAFILAVEFLGAVFLTLRFMGKEEFLTAAYLGIFHSVAAFCNAGFSPFSDSLISFSGDAVLLTTISALIVLGGIGFFAMVDIYDSYRQKHVHLLVHTKIVIAGTVLLLLLGFLFFFVCEKTGFFVSIFQSASLRTAGFSAVDTDGISLKAKLFVIFLMSIGGAPASAAGGLKITTVAVLAAFTFSFIRSKNETTIFKHSLPDEIIKKAALVFILFICLIAFFTSLLIIVEPDKNAIDLIFETVSAFSNMGLSINITGGLSSMGRILIILDMLIGRIGILTILFSAAAKSSKNKRVGYPQASVIVG